MDVCIIGAGWSGIYACKYALENGLKPIVLERRNDIGGVWNYSDDPEITTVMKSTISSSSRLVTEASDFFMDESIGHFMHHTDVIDYLRAYIEKFKLSGYLQFGADVKSVKKVDGYWHVTYEQNGETKNVVASKLAVCAGLHNKKKPIGEPISSFSGKVIHAGDFKEIKPSDFSEDDRVLVYGGGETASDIIDLLVKTPAKITWAIRGGQHFLRKTLFFQRKGVGQYEKHDFALDTIASGLINAVSRFSRGAPGRRFVTDFLSTGSFAGYQGHGVHLWRNQYKYAQQFFNKNGHSVEHVGTGRIIPENDITEVIDNIVEFKSGDRELFTHIICCFGYQFHCPFLPKPYHKADLEKFYQFVFPPDDTSIGFFGFARPIIGSIPLLTEMQCLWAFRAWSGKIDFRSSDEMAHRQAENIAYWDRKVPGRGNLRTLVQPATYVGLMIKESFPGRSPGEHFWKHPLRAIRFLTWIPSGSMRFAIDPNLSNREFTRLWRARKHGLFLGWILPFLIVMIRLLRLEKMNDWYVNRRERKRLQREMSSVKTARVVKIQPSQSPIEHRKAA